MLMTESAGGSVERTKIDDCASSRAAARLRQHQILSLARERGSVNVTEAAQEVGVSVETFRRDHVRRQRLYRKR